MIMTMDGLAAIENGVRLCFASNIRLGRGVYLDHGAYLHACPNGITIGAGTLVMANAILHVYNFRNLPHAGIVIGENALIGEASVIRGQGGVTIGNSVYTAPLVQILAVNHVFDDPTRPIIDQGITAEGIVIEDDAWIGAGAIITDGVHVGRGSVVGAGAVVTQRCTAPHGRGRRARPGDQKPSGRSHQAARAAGTSRPAPGLLLSEVTMSKLSVIIPAYNEVGCIATIIEWVLAIERPLADAGIEGLEVIVVDDGSQRWHG